MRQTVSIRISMTSLETKKKTQTLTLGHQKVMGRTAEKKRKIKI